MLGKDARVKDERDDPEELALLHRAYTWYVNYCYELLLDQEEVQKSLAESAAMPQEPSAQGARTMQFTLLL